MKKRNIYARGNRRLRAAVCCLMVLALTLAGCAADGVGNDDGQPVEKQEFQLNTVCNIRLQEWEGSRADAEALADQAFALSRELESKLSRTIAGSAIHRINNAGGQPVEIIDGRVMEVLERSFSYCELSGGRFDITVGKLAALWNFSSGDNIVPADDLIQAELPHVNYRNLSWEKTADGEEQRWLVTLADPQACIDLGAIAKGYIVEQVAGFLRENGVTQGIVDFGGNIACIGGKEEGEPWYIGIRSPFSQSDSVAAETQTVGLVHVTADGSAVTSGTYERKFEQDGVLYHHILDPETGYPCDTDVSGVTIVGNSSTDCDALSTICLLLGKDQGLALIETLPDAEAVFITKDGGIHCSSGVVFEALQ